MTKKIRLVTALLATGLFAQAHAADKFIIVPVSYTHLTLPTILLV